VRGSIRPRRPCYDSGMETLDIFIFVALALMSFTIIGAGIAYVVIEYRMRRERQRQLTPLIGVVLPKGDSDVS